MKAPGVVGCLGRPSLPCWAGCGPQQAEPAQSWAAALRHLLPSQRSEEVSVPAHAMRPVKILFRAEAPSIMKQHPISTGTVCLTLII